MEQTLADARRLLEAEELSVILSRGAFQLILAKHPPEEAKTAFYFPLSSKVQQQHPLIAETLKLALDSGALQLIEAHVLFAQEFTAPCRGREQAFSVQFDTTVKEAILALCDETVPQGN